MEDLDSIEVLGSERNKIIESILTQGLKSATALIGEGSEYLGSSDSIPRKHIHGALVDLGASMNVQNALYNGHDSVFPVLTERKDEHYLFNRQVLRLIDLKIELVHRS